MDHFLCINTCGFLYDVVVYPKKEFIEAKTATNTDASQTVIQSMADDIFSFLGKYTSDNYKITFRTSLAGDALVSDGAQTACYLKAIDRAIRKYFDEKKLLPSISLSFNNARLDDHQLQVITKLVKDHLIGRPDPALKCISSLALSKNRELSNDAILELVSAIFDSHVWELDLMESGNGLNPDTLRKLRDLECVLVPELYLKFKISQGIKLTPRTIKW